MIMNRRGILLGLASALAAPAIVHAGNLMPIKAIDLGYEIVVKGLDQYGQYATETFYMDKPPITPVQRIDFIAERTKLKFISRIITPDVYVMV